MQAYAEGFDIIKFADSKEVAEEHRFTFDLAEIAEVWRRGSVVGSWLLDLTAMALIEDPELSKFTGSVQDSGEGRWTIMAAIEEAVPCDVLLGISLHPVPLASGPHFRGKRCCPACATSSAATWNGPPAARSCRFGLPAGETACPTSYGCPGAER